MRMHPNGKHNQQTSEQPSHHGGGPEHFSRECLEPASVSTVADGRRNCGRSDKQGQKQDRIDPGQEGRDGHVGYSLAP